MDKKSFNKVIECHIKNEFISNIKQINPTYLELDTNVRYNDKITWDIDNMKNYLDKPTKDYFDSYFNKYIHFFDLTKSKFDLVPICEYFSFFDFKKERCIEKFFY